MSMLKFIRDRFGRSVQVLPEEPEEEIPPIPVPGKWPFDARPMPREPYRFETEEYFRERVNAVERSRVLLWRLLSDSQRAELWTSRSFTVLGGKSRWHYRVDWRQDLELDDPDGQCWGSFCIYQEGGATYDFAASMAVVLATPEGEELVLRTGVWSPSAHALTSIGSFIYPRCLLDPLELEWMDYNGTIFRGRKPIGKGSIR